MLPATTIAELARQLYAARNRAPRCVTSRGRIRR